MAEESAGANWCVNWAASRWPWSKSRSSSACTRRSCLARFLAGLRQKGLSRADELPAKHAKVAVQMEHQEKQLALILQATLAKLTTRR